MNTKIENEISLKDLSEILWKKKRLVIIITLMGSFLSVLISLSYPNIYKVDSILSPVEINDNSSSALNLGSLSSIGGLGFANNKSERTNEVIEVLRSYKFFNEYIYTDVYLPNLFAYKSWNEIKNLSKYDANIFDIQKGEWKRSVKLPRTARPSSQESFKKFKENHFLLDIDEDTGFLKISIEHQSPYIAKRWLETILEAINLKFREEDKQKAIKSIEYLEKKILETKYNELNNVLAELIKKEIQTLSLVEKSDEYVLKIIEKPFIKEEKEKPNRAQISILGSLVSFIFSIILSLIVTFRKSYN